ncbi:MAG: hypothetical protein R3D85_02185 [Paracoccaceae bacterium]
MTYRTTGLLASAAALALTAGASLATTILTNGTDGTITNSLCVGQDCTGSENFGFDTLRLKENNTRIKFDDTSASGSFPYVDWQIRANGSNNGDANELGFDDITNNKTPFLIGAGAPTNSLVVKGSSGDIGIGTANPSLELHVVDGDSPALRLQQDSSNGWSPHTWDIAGNETNFFIRDVNNSSHLPFRILPGSGTDDALVIKGNGYVGLGTDNPSAALHVRHTDGNAMVLVEELNGTSGPRTLINLKNNGRPEVVMANTSENGEWSFGAGTKFILKQGAVGTTSGAKTKMLEIDELGNATFTGTVTSSGPTCSTGCDAVFDADYPLPSIADHAAQMFALGHLPNVGPTRPNEPVNMSEQYGRMLNELEKAHIYISELAPRKHRPEGRHRRS